MWLCQMRVVRKAERSTCLELDECENSLCFFLNNGYMSEDQLLPKCNCRSLNEQDFLFASFQHSSPPHQSCILYSSRTHRNFLRWDHDVSGVCMSGVCVTPSALRRTEQTNHGGRKPCGTQICLRIQDRSAQHWGLGCNSPSVCGLGWCGGRGELQVSHGKAYFIVCLRE